MTDNLPFHEAGLLKLNCDKALFHLKWEATLSYKECVKLVSDWYVNFYQGDATDYLAFTNQQINEYQKIAESKGIRWL